MKDIHDLHDDAALETLLRAALDRSGEPPPFAVDVADAVMARVTGVGPAPTAELGWRQFTRWAMAAGVIGVALFASAASQSPSLGEIAQQLGRTTADSMGTATKLTEPAVNVAGGLGRAAVVLFEAVRTVARPLESLRPLAQLLLVLSAAAMAGVSAVVVGRDLGHFTGQKEQA